MIRVVVESPFGRNVDGSKCTPDEYARNVRYLNRALLDSLRRGESPYASHRFFPGLLDDTDPADRELGMRAGLAWATQAQACAVYDDHGVTEGMLRGMAQHAARGMIIERRQIGQETLRDTWPVPEDEPIPFRLSSDLPTPSKAPDPETSDFGTVPGAPRLPSHICPGCDEIAGAHAHGCSYADGDE